MVRALLFFMLAAPLGAQITLLNVGGSEYTDGGGRTWAASGSGCDGTAFGDSGFAIDDTTDDTLYATGHKATSAFACSFTVASGYYRVRLLFAELEGLSAGQRSFNVQINGSTYLSNLDVAARAGGVLTAYERDVLVPVAGTSISLAFARVSGDPFVNAIEISRVDAFTTGDTDPTNCAEGEYFYNTTDDEFHVCTATDTWTAFGVSVGSSVSPAEMADADFGGFTCSSGTCSIDSPAAISVTGNAATATALAENGANCSAGQAPLGVDASGAVEGCFTPSTVGAVNDLSDVTETSRATDDVLKFNGTAYVNVNLLAAIGQDLATTNCVTFELSGALGCDADLTFDGTDLTLGGSITAGAAAATFIIAEGATADDFETTFQVTDPTADRTVTFPDSSITVEGTGHASKHQNGGADEVATATPGANAIPKAEADGDLNAGWIGQDQTFTWTGDHDHSGGTFEVPNSTSLPGTCDVGDAYMDTDATSGSRWYLCESTNTWAVQGGGGGGGSKPDRQEFYPAVTGHQGDLRLGSGFSVLSADDPDFVLDTGAGQGLLAFDATTDETAYFYGHTMADDYDGGALTIRLFLDNSGSGGTNNESRWDVTVAGEANGDGPAAPSANTDSSTTASHVASQLLVHTVTISGAELNSLAAGDLLRVLITRDADHSEDTWTADQHMIGIEIQYGRS